jgi:hypothetical protein
MRTKKALVCDLDPSVKVSTRVLGSGNSQPTVVCNEVYVVTDGNLVTDGDQIWFTAESEQVRAEDLYILAYLDALTAEVSDGIAIEPRGIYR